LGYGYVRRYEPDKAVGRMIGSCGIEGKQKDGDCGA
jgi:hypothetical protein